MKHNKIIITIRGGIVHSVYITPALLPVQTILLDYDSVENGEEFDTDQMVAEGEIENHQVIEVL